MKRMVHRNLTKVIIIGTLLSLAANCYLQIKLTERNMHYSSEVLFWQINQILAENETDIEDLKQDFKTRCLTKAKTAAYIIQNHPEVIDSQNELIKITNLLQVDELHIFNTDGAIYAGSEPKYFGFHFHSGKQMEFFLPLLTDKKLELCQSITPNTAEGKLMQYAAVWCEDGENIIQIGMKPSHIIEMTKKNELSYIFSLLTPEEGQNIFAADPHTYEILGSTDESCLGKTLFDIGISKKQITTKMEKFHASINGTHSYCTFTKQNDILIGRVCSVRTMYQSLHQETILLVLYLLGLSIIMIATISRYLDKTIIQGIDGINKKLLNITAGDLSEKISIDTSPEFTELSGHINDMVKSLLNTTDKLSSVLDTIQTPIGIYEYRHESGRVRITSKIPEILALSETDKKHLLADCTLFEEKLAEIQKHPCNKEKTYFQLPYVENRFIKIDSYGRENSIFGILMDITEDINKQKRIERERDEDVLTGLYNRRAFYAETERLFQQPDLLKHAMFIAIDTDRLKMVNDTYGHEAGDCYLCGMADILRSCTAPQKIVSRLSGDEFEILIYGCETHEELTQYVHELETKQNGIVSVFPQPYLEVPIYFSVGCAFYPEDGTDYNRLLKYADSRMYKEKRHRHKREH